MHTVLADIRALFDRHGHLIYSGEQISQLEHALQTAALAEAAAASPELIVTAFLHDLGHLLNLRGNTPTKRGIDDWHQNMVTPYLHAFFPAAVLEPIRLHVDAKRCLCAIDPSYEAQLSDDSRRSLQLQGGIFDAAEVAQFMRQPHAGEALQLRRWDDSAKEIGRTTPDVDHYLGLASRLLINPNSDFA